MFSYVDTETRVRKIENLLKYLKVYVDDTKTNYDHTSIQPYDGCFVKLFVSQKTNEEMYSKLIERFYNEINVHELVIVEDPSDIRTTVRDDILDQGEDTLTFLNNYVDQIDTDLDKRKLKEFAKELYVRRE